MSNHSIVLKKISKGACIASLTIAALSLQSCLIAAIGSGVGAWKWGDAKKSEAETKCKKAYPDYFMNMQKVNQIKAKNHQKLEEVMTMEQYCHIEKKEEEKQEAAKTGTSTNVGTSTKK